VELRAYRAGDAQATSVIFLRAVRETARAHYSPEQVEAWAADYGDLDSWAAARAAAHTQLAIIDGHVAGLDDHGYIDMLFVDPDFGRHGGRVGAPRIGNRRRPSKTYAMRCVLASTTAP
jgi:putative acetyltransferase